MTATVIPFPRRPAVPDAGRHHPALRWLIDDQVDTAHRRAQRSETVCGADGTLTIAPQHVRLCPQCFPERAVQ